MSGCGAVGCRCGVEGVYTLHIIEFDSLGLSLTCFIEIVLFF